VRLLRVVLALAVFVALGCEQAATGPTASEFNDKRAALKQRAAKKKSGKQAETKVARANAALAGPGLGPVDADYVYDATGKRDPFRDFKWDRPDRLVRSEEAGPLEQFDLSQLSLVAVVWKTGNARALVQDPSGDSYIIAEGARIGRNEGFVTAIDDNMLRVREKYIDSVGHETMKDIELSMRRNEGG
jgi:Tfp pilus assembly protein PilP